MRYIKYYFVKLMKDILIGCRLYSYSKAITVANCCRNSQI